MEQVFLRRKAAFTKTLLGPSAIAVEAVSALVLGAASVGAGLQCNSPIAQKAVCLIVVLGVAVRLLRLCYSANLSSHNYDYTKHMQSNAMLVIYLACKWL